MNKFKFKSTINASKEQVWDKLKNFGAIQDFNPGVTKSYYISENKEGVEAARICELAPMGKIAEVVTKWEDGEAYHIDIKAIEKIPPIKDMKAVLRLKSLGANKTEATIDFSYRAKNIVGRLMKPIINKQFTKGLEGLLEGLKVHTETGRLINSFKDLKAA